jgi:hypothetical protein
MRAHAMRRVLWIGNVALGLAVTGIVGWYFLDGRKATADPARLKPDWAAKAKEAYGKRGHPGRIENAAVSNKEVETIDRPDYVKLNYWIFSGPMPPAPRVDEGPVVEAPKPTGLETMGRILMLMYLDPDVPGGVASNSVVTWEFPSKARKRFKPGDFVVEKPADPQRFKLTDVKRVPGPSSAYKIHYEVYDDPKAGPVRTAELVYDTTPKPGTVIRPVKPAPEPGAAVPVEAGPGAGRPRTGLAPGTPGVAAPDVPAEPRAPARFEDFNPRVDRSDDGGTVTVRFEDREAEYIRSKSAQEWAETVKTQPATDRRTGQPLGLKVTGISPDSPVGKFDVRPGDILVSIDGKPVRDRSDVVNIVQHMDPNTARVTIVIDRNGRKITFVVDPRDNATRRRAGQLAEQQGLR